MEPAARKALCLSNSQGPSSSHPLPLLPRTAHQKSLEVGFEDGPRQRRHLALALLLRSICLLVLAGARARRVLHQAVLA